MQRESSFSPSHLEVAHSCHQDSLHWGPHTSQSQSGHLDFHNHCPRKTQLPISHLIAFYNTKLQECTLEQTHHIPFLCLLLQRGTPAFCSSWELPVFLLSPSSPFTSVAQCSKYGPIACFFPMTVPL